MNSRLLVKGILGCLLCPIWIAPVASRAADPPDLAVAAEPAKESADDNSNPYAIIVERNIFHLNPLPPPPEPEKPKVEVPVVKISGFVNIGHKRTVLFVSQPKDKKDGPLYYSLTEGEKTSDGKLELVKIHSAEESVDVINDGVAATLTAKDDSVGASPIAAAPVAAAGAPPAPNVQARIPGRRIFPNRPGEGGNGFAPLNRRRNQLPPPTP